jgi:two-component system invasion response regulator UvrY
LKCHFINSKKEMIKVLIVDDHPVVRKGLKNILEACPEIKVTGEAGQGSELIEKAIHNYFDVILLDISLPGRNGLDLLKVIKSINQGIAVIILSIHPEEQYAVRALKLGAAGYLTKSTAPDELITAVKRAAQGRKYITSTIAEALAFNISYRKPLHKTLSNREFEVMCLLAEGKSLSEIAEELSLSIKTISTYRKRILIKMNLKNTSGIIRYAIKAGLVE